MDPDNEDVELLQRLQEIEKREDEQNRADAEREASRGWLVQE